MGSEWTTSLLPDGKPRRASWPRLCVLVALLLSSEVVYLALQQLNAVNGLRPVVTFWMEMGVLFALYAAAYFVVLRLEGREKPALFIIALGAVMFRLTLLPAGVPPEISGVARLQALKTDVQGTEVVYERFQLFDDDIWRYLWDGHVWANGVNPYEYAPADAALDGLTLAQPKQSWIALRQQTDAAAETTGAEFSGVAVIEASEESIWSDIRDNINHSDVPTIYTPLAQIVFRLSHAIAPGSVTMLKGLLVLCELLAVLFLILALRQLGLSVLLVILYAWNPLMVKVFAGSGHADAILVAALAATAFFIARGARRAAAISFALAILAKLSPVILLPFVLRRIGWRNLLLVGGVLLCGYFPFLHPSVNPFTGMQTFAREWQFNAGFFALGQWLASGVTAHAAVVARVLSGLATLGMVSWLLWQDDLRAESFARYTSAAMGALVLFSPTVMPWYLSWVLPLAVIARQHLWFLFSAIVCIAFHIMIDETEATVALVLEYGLLFVLLSWSLLRHWGNWSNGSESNLNWETS